MSDGWDLEIKVHRIHRFADQERATKAVADISINDCLVIKGLTIVSGSNGMFVKMPQEKSKTDEKWYDTVRCITPEIKTQIQDIVLAKFNE